MATGPEVAAAVAEAHRCEWAGPQLADRLDFEIDDCPELVGHLRTLAERCTRAAR